MRVHVKLFAGLRERAGWSERELDGVDRVGGVWPALDLGDEPDGLLYAVNKEYADRNRPLVDGDEVALIPPVSGGAFLVSGEPLSLDAVVDEVRSDQAGAIATFIGTTRVQSRGHTVLHLDYEAYEEMAETVMADIAEELKRRYDRARSRSTTAPAASTSARPASSSPSRRHTGRTPSRHARRQSTRSKAGCRSGKRSSTRAARSGSAAVHRSTERRARRPDDHFRVPRTTRG